MLSHPSDDDGITGFVVLCEDGKFISLSDGTTDDIRKAHVFRKAPPEVFGFRVMAVTVSHATIEEAATSGAEGAK